MITKAEREQVAAALAELVDLNDGVLTPDSVVAAAADKDSVLHRFFEWDNKKAALEHRLEQARSLIRSVQVVITTEKTTVHTVAYIRNPDSEPDEQGYVPTKSLIGNEDRARAALVAEFSRAAAALRRARELAIVFDMDGEVNAIAESVETVRTKVEGRVEQTRQ